MSERPPVPLSALASTLDLELVCGPDVPVATGPDDAGPRVVEWRPERRGGPLPDLLPLVAPTLRPTVEGEPVAVVVLCPDRRVNPPEPVLAAVRAAGGSLLWGGPGVRAESVAERLDELRRHGAAPDVTSEAVALLEALASGAGVPALVARVATVLEARVTVTAGGRVVADEPPAAPEGLAVVATLPLEIRPRDVVGELSVARDRPLGSGEQVVLRALANVLGLAVRAQAADEAEEAPARDLLAIILGEDLVAREAALRRARRLQAFPRRRSVVVVLEPFGSPLSQTGMARLVRHLELTLHAEDDRAVMVLHEGSVVILVSADIALDRLLRTLRRRASLPLAVGTSRVVDDSRSFPGAYRQALRAATLGRRLGRANQVTDYDQLGVLRLLYQLPEHERRAFALEVLGPLAGDGEDAAAQRGVLHALRAVHGNITEAARRLFIHPNTLRQRIARIESQIGPFLADADRRLTVFVALDLHLLDADDAR